jgi:hypothetical protein
MKRAIVSAAVLLCGASAFGQAPGAPPGPPSPPPAPTDVPTIPGARIVMGQAPVVGGNAAGARERALDDALKQAVNQTLATIVDPQTRAAQAKTLKAIEAKARSFVPRYRTLEEGEANGVYSMRLEAEVDEIALRRKLERGSTSAPPPGTPTKAGAPGMLVAAGDKGEASAAFVTGLVTALSSAGVRARAGDPGETSAGTAAQAAARASLEQAALVTSEVMPEGVLRGTGRVAVACRANVRLVAAPAGSTIAERAATALVFVDADKAAEGAGQCRTQLGADLAGRLAGAVAAGGAGAGSAGDLRPVIVDADVVEPGAIPELVKSLRGIGAVSAAELTRVGAGRAEIKVRTRAAPPALAAALSRVAGGMITLSDVQISGDTIHVRARLRAAAPSAAGAVGGSP